MAAKKSSYDYQLIVATTVVLGIISLICVYAMFHFKWAAIHQLEPAAKWAYMNTMNGVIAPFIVALILLLGICVPKRLLPEVWLHRFTALLLAAAGITALVAGIKAALLLILFASLALQLVVLVLALLGRANLNFESKNYWVRLGSSLVHLGLILFVLDLYFHRHQTLHLVLFWVTTAAVVLGMLFCFYAEQTANLLRRLPGLKARPGRTSGLAWFLWMLPVLMAVQPMPAWAAARAGAAAAPLTGAEAPLHLVLNSPFSAPITAPDGSGFLDLLYGELFGRLGISFAIQLLPGERALSNANAGIDDGDVCRIAGLEAVYPELRRTEEGVLEYRMTVFSRRHDFPVQGPESLRPYELGFLGGWKILESVTAGHPRRQLLDTTDQLFLMLAHDRLELVIIDQLLGREAVERLGLSEIKPLSPPLLTGTWYLYLHEKHRALLPAIDRELRRMKEDGTYQSLRRQTLGAYEQFDPREHLP